MRNKQGKGVIKTYCDVCEDTTTFVFTGKTRIWVKANQFTYLTNRIEMEEIVCKKCGRRLWRKQR